MLDFGGCDCLVLPFFFRLWKSDFHESPYLQMQCTLYLRNKQLSETYHFLPRVSWEEGRPMRQLDTQLLIDNKKNMFTLTRLS